MLFEVIAERFTHTFDMHFQECAGRRDFATLAETHEFSVLDFSTLHTTCQRKLKPGMSVTFLK